MRPNTLNRKGQGAMEYLMTYGWAILVVMIVGLALWQLGIFSGGPSPMNSASGFGKLKVMEQSIKYDAAAGVLEFSIMNGAGNTINGANYTASGDCTITSGNEVSISADGIMNAGESSSENITCGIKGVGQHFATTLNITYAFSITGVNIVRYETGIISGSTE